MGARLQLDEVIELIFEPIQSHGGIGLVGLDNPEGHADVLIIRDVAEQAVQPKADEPNREGHFPIHAGCGGMRH